MIPTAFGGVATVVAGMGSELFAISIAIYALTLAVLSLHEPLNADDSDV